MTNKTNIDYTAFRHVDLATHWREATPVQKQARLTERHERHLEKALQMPMYKNLPTVGFEYDLKQFRNHDGRFVVQIKRSNQSNHCINKHVKHLSPREMDAFCANIFDKATQFLGDLPKPGVEEFWAKVAQESGIKLRQGTVETVAFWDWAMKIVAARIVYGQKEGQEFQSLSIPSITGDIDMTDQTNTNEADLESLSLTAQAVDKFLVAGVAKYGAIPKKLKAITRHHTFIRPPKPRANKRSKKGSASAKKVTKNAETHHSHLPGKLTVNTGNTIRLRRSEFGSQIGAGEPAWWGSINRPRTSKGIPTHGLTATEFQRQEVTAQGRSGQAGTVDDLVIGIHGTTIKDDTKAPQVLTNLAIRTANPLKRRHSDDEGAEDSTFDHRPMAKMQKVSENQVEASGSPSQLDEA